MSATDWNKFDYSDFECGIFWVCAVGSEYDVDVGNYGEVVGVPTGGTVTEVALVHIEEGVDGEPYFYPIDSTNFGRVDDEFVVTHYAELKIPKAPAAPVTHQG